MSWKPQFLLAAIIFASPVAAIADELTRIIQQDLATLGYDPGNTDGEASTKTVIAISKFQSEHNLDVTGEASPQLAGVIKAALKEHSGAGQAAQPAVVARPAAPQNDQAALHAAQQACLQEKMAQAQESAKKKRGFGRLMNAVGRTASRFGGSDTSRMIAQTSSDVYSATATAADLKGAAEDLGLTEGDMEECRNP